MLRTGTCQTALLRGRSRLRRHSIPVAAACCQQTTASLARWLAALQASAARGLSALARMPLPGDPGAAPSARAWTRTLPSAVASAGPGDDGQPARVGGELAQQLVARPAADDVHDVGVPPGQRLRVEQRPPVGERQAVEDAPDDLARASPATGRAACGQPVAIRAGMSPGGRNTGSSASMTNRSGSARPPRRSSDSSGAGRRSPVPQALLQQPQPADVAQVPDGPVDPGLVGEVRQPGSPRSAPARSSSIPTSDQVPEEM